MLGADPVLEEVTAKRGGPVPMICHGHATVPAPEQGE